MKKYCLRGHRLAGKNLSFSYVDRKDFTGWVRECRACRRIRNASPKRYEQSQRWNKTPKGKAAKRMYDKRYKKTPAGKVSHRLARQRYVDSGKRALWYERWLATPAGRRRQVLHSHRLLASAPGDLIKTCELLRALKQEMKREHKRA
jgi:hypothetical protein